MHPASSARRRPSSSSHGSKGRRPLGRRVGRELRVSTSIPKGARALVEVNGRRNFKSLFAGKARRHNDTAYIPTTSYVYHGLQHSSVKIQMAVLMSKLETATGTVRVTRMRHGDYAATCSTVRCKRVQHRSTEAGVCSIVRLQRLPTTSTRNCNCENAFQHSFLHI